MAKKRPIMCWKSCRALVALREAHELLSLLENTIDNYTSRRSQSSLQKQIRAAMRHIAGVLGT